MKKDNYRLRAIPGNTLFSRHPEIAKEWHPSKNGDLTPKDVSRASAKMVWWQCRKGHEWQARVYKRTLGKKCPYCAGKKVSRESSLAGKFPLIAKEWHPNKNGKLSPAAVPPFGKYRAWWKCLAGHEWQARIDSRHFSGCPFCSGLRAHPGHCLKNSNPALSREWHPKLNRGLGPEDVTPFSNRHVWWKCKNGHIWKAPVGRRNAGAGCLLCYRDSLKKRKKK